MVPRNQPKNSYFSQNRIYFFHKCKQESQFTELSRRSSKKKSRGSRDKGHCLTCLFLCMVFYQFQVLLDIGEKLSVYQTTFYTVNFEELQQSDRSDHVRPPQDTMQATIEEPWVLTCYWIQIIKSSLFGRDPLLFGNKNVVYTLIFWRCGRIRPATENCTFATSPRWTAHHYFTKFKSRIMASRGLQMAIIFNISLLWSNMISHGHYYHFVKLYWWNSELKRRWVTHYKTLWYTKVDLTTCW